MTSRIARFVISTILLLPTSALAQFRGAPERVAPGHTRLSFAAVYALRYTRVEERSILLPDGTASGRFETNYGPGVGASVLAEVVAAGALRGMTSLTLLQRSDGRQRSATGDVTTALPGSTFVFATAGLALRLSDPAPGYQERRNLHTSFRAGPTYAVELSRSADASDPDRRALPSWGLGLGMEAEAAIADALTFQLGVEDHVLLANRAELARRLNEDFARVGVDASTIVDSPSSHVLLLRAGFAFTFR